MTDPADAPSALDKLDAMFDFLRAETMGGLPNFSGDWLKDPKGAVAAHRAASEQEQRRIAAKYARFLTTDPGLEFLGQMIAITIHRPAFDIGAAMSVESIAMVAVWSEAQNSLVRMMCEAARTYLNEPANEGASNEDDDE